MPIGDVVLIDWVDANTEEGWRTESFKGWGLMQVRTVGFLLEENKDFVSVYPSGTQERSRSDITSIPRVCIKKMKTIYKVK